MAKNPLRNRIGGRGCPSCGSHNTAGLAHRGAHWCEDCNHRWVPCRPGCRGYDTDTTGPVPVIHGCKDCGVPDRIARWWPEAYRLMSKKLAEIKMEPLATAPSRRNAP